MLVETGASIPICVLCSLSKTENAMGSDLILAWSEYWPEVLKVDEFCYEYIGKTRGQKYHLTSALCNALSRLARKKGIEDPFSDVHKFYDTVDWEKISYGIKDNPEFLPLAQRIEYVREKYDRRYSACSHGYERILSRWVDYNFQWLGKGERFGFILGGWYFDDGVKIEDIVSTGAHYNPQDWERVRKNAAGFLSAYENQDDAPWALRHILEVADTVLASGQPEKFMICHDF